MQNLSKRGSASMRKNSWYLSELAKLPDLDAKVIMAWFEQRVRKEKPPPDLTGVFLEEEKKYQNSSLLFGSVTKSIAAILKSSQKPHILAGLVNYYMPAN